MACVEEMAAVALRAIFTAGAVSPSQPAPSPVVGAWPWSSTSVPMLKTTKLSLISTVIQVSSQQSYLRNAMKSSVPQGKISFDIG